MIKADEQRQKEQNWREQIINTARSQVEGKELQVEAQVEKATPNEKGAASSILAGGASVHGSVGAGMPEVEGIQLLFL